MFNEKDVFKNNNYTTHQKGFIIMNPAIPLVLENKDQRGAYIFKATIRDNVLNKISSGEYSFTLVDTSRK